jgi:hypothetical protein
MIRRLIAPPAACATAPVKEPGPHPEELAKQASRRMDATHGLAAILRDARNGALLRMRPEIYSRACSRGDAGSPFNFRSRPAACATASVKEPGPHPEELAKQASRRMDATHGLAAILRDARNGALLRMRPEIYSRASPRGGAGRQFNFRSRPAACATAPVKEPGPHPEELAKQASRRMDATHGLAAILRDARNGALLRMRSQTYSRASPRGGAGSPFNFRSLFQEALA